MPRVKRDESPGTRDAILAAARQVLLDDGLSGVSTRRVAAVAGVNQALVHYHFGSIENLLLEVVASVAADTRRSERIFFGPGDLQTKWRRFMNDLLTDEIPSGTSKVWLETLFLVASKPESRDRYMGMIAESTYERLYEVVRAGLPDDAKPSEIEGLTALIMSVRKSLSVDALIGWDRGQLELLQLVDSIIRQRMDGRSLDQSKRSEQWPASMPSVAERTS